MLPLFHQDENFQIGLDLVYTLCLVPIDHVQQAWDTVVLPFFEEHFVDNVEVDLFLAYVESTWIGKRRTRGARNKPRFDISIWNIHLNVMEERTTTNNAIESWNARWNQSIGTNYNIWRVINKFKTEDSLARTKLREAVSGRDIEPNPARKNRRTERLSGLKTALQRFDADNLKEFLFALRGDA